MVSITAVICTNNEELYLERCLRSLQDLCATKFLKKKELHHSYMQ